MVACSARAVLSLPGHGIQSEPHITSNLVPLVPSSQYLCDLLSGQGISGLHLALCLLPAQSMIRVATNRLSSDYTSCWGVVFLFCRTITISSGFSLLDMQSLHFAPLLVPLTTLCASPKIGHATILIFIRRHGAFICRWLCCELSHPLFFAEICELYLCEFRVAHRYNKCLNPFGGCSFLVLASAHQWSLPA
jgi:hypothetical protein